MRSTLLIVTALQMEERTLRRAIDPGGSKYSFDIEFQSVGIKCEALPEKVPARANRVLLAGLAGGLAPHLRVGDIVLDGRDDDPMPGIPDIHAGHIHTVTRPACTPAEKQALADSTGALAVDMEGSIVRRWAMKGNVRFVHLRAISDAAGDAINPAVMKLVDPMGKPKPAKIAAFLLRDPTRIRELRTLQANSKVALNGLSKAIVQLLDHLNASS